MRALVFYACASLLTAALPVAAQVSGTAQSSRVQVAGTPADAIEGEIQRIVRHEGVIHVSGMRFQLDADTHYRGVDGFTGLRSGQTVRVVYVEDGGVHRVHTVERGSVITQ